MEVTQATITNGSKYCKNIWYTLIWAELTKNAIKNSRVRLSFCHTVENTVYSRFLQIDETVENKRKPQCYRIQNITRDVQLYKSTNHNDEWVKKSQRTSKSLFCFSRINKKKYSKCDSNTLRFFSRVSATCKNRQ